MNGRTNAAAVGGKTEEVTFTLNGIWNEATYIWCDSDGYHCETPSTDGEHTITKGSLLCVLTNDGYRYIGFNVSGGAETLKNDIYAGFVFYVTDNCTLNLSG